VCPEFNSPVIRSLQGDLLRFASLDYLKSLKRGCALLVLSFGATIVVSALSIGSEFVSTSLFGSAFPGQLVIVGLIVISSIVSGVDWWLLSSPDPGYGW